MLTSLSPEAIVDVDKYLPHLSYDDRGVLHVAGRNAEELAEREGTPLILYFEDRLVDNLRSFHSAFASFFPNVRTFFALKACYVPACVRALKAAGANVEVMSDVEMQIAEINGFATEQMVANGFGRSHRYLEKSLDGPVDLNVIDSLEDLVALQGIARKRGTVAQVGLRAISPIVLDEMMVRPSCKVGMDWEQGVFLDVLDEALRMPEIKVKGILTHQFAHAKSVEQYAQLMKSVSDLVMSILETRGHAFDVIDVGGGLDTRYLIELQGLTSVDFAKVAYHYLSRIPYKFTLYTEPGRYIAADAAVGIASILAEKRNAKTTWRVPDISSNVLLPWPDTAYQPIPLRLPSGSTWELVSLGDPTCAPSLTCPDVMLPSGSEGRKVALLNCGAYTTVTAFLGGFVLPRILFVDPNGIHETFGKRQYVRMMRAFYGYDIDV